MATTGDGRPRYPKHRPTPGPPMVVDGKDLGPALLPQDIYIWQRHVMALDDAEILAAFAVAVDRLRDDGQPTPFAELHPDDLREMIAQAKAVTRSRLEAWRRRNRQMTWLELRALYVGLRETEV